MDIKQRQIIPIKDAFFNDGYWYVLSSTSLGGKNFAPAEISQKLQSKDPAVIKQLLEDGVCLPVCFPEDCALDQSVIVTGELDQEEQDEWIARLRARLEIPCGEFMLMGGAMEEHFEESLPMQEPGGENGPACQKVQLQPGTYLVEIYAFLGSATVNEEWEEWPYDLAPEEWWNNTRSGDHPAWIKMYAEEECVEAEDLGMLEYIIRLAPLNEDIPIPDIDEEDTNWVVDFETRKPKQCPQGIKREKYL